MTYKIKNIDNYFDKFIDEFMKIPNIELIKTDEYAKIQHKFLIDEFSSLYDIKILFLEHYIPAAKKHVENSKKEYRKSKYYSDIKKLLHYVDESYYETIRLGYVALFHRYESFIHNLLKVNIKIYELPFKDEKEFDKYLKEEIKFNLFRNYRIIKPLHEINWICNSVKHCDGYPNPKNKPNSCKKIPINEKLKISEDTLKKHFDSMEGIYQLLLQIINPFAFSYPLPKTENNKLKIKITKFIELVNKHYNNDL